MAKQKYKFERLTPIDNMDLDVYEEAIDYVFSNSDVKNVAISGAYSAGKSSVLASYKKKHDELRFLHISLAHFKSTDQESDAEVKESTLEGKILNQLIHQIPSEKIPQTNFRVKKTVSSKSIATSTIGAVLFLISILHLLFFSVWKNYIGVLPVSLIKSILMPSTHPYALIVDGIIILVLLSLSVYKLIRIVNQNSAPLNHNEAEIAGYRDALNEIHLGYEHIDFRQSDILRLHEMMMSFAGYEYGGQYKTDDNVILEIDTVGNRRVRFRPTPASETPKAMEQLELAYLDARSDANINQLLLIPCVILDFLCIHPFRDGNGRMSRLLSLLLLYKNGFDAGKYVSFEEQISNYKAYYYEALRQSSAGWETNENSYFPFMENFLSTLYMCYKELDKRFAVVHGKKITKKARVEATVLNSLTPLSKAEICKILPDVSPTTVEAVLGAMVKTGSVKRIGSGRATRYIKV